MRSRSNDWLKTPLIFSALLLVLFTFATDASAQNRPGQNQQSSDQSPQTSKNPADLQKPPPETESHKVTWEDWEFQWQFRDIEGLVLTDVYFKGIKVAKYIGLAEIYVPYATGSPRPVDFTLGGFIGNPMQIDIARDCYANGRCQALMKDGTVAEGDFADLMIHEDELGFAYAGAAGRAPGKVMVLWSMCHFPGPGDGYTYVIRWKLHSDGKIRAEVGATGGLQHLNLTKNRARALNVGKDENGEDVYAPSHVHNFYFQVDLDIDGESPNSVQELNYQNDKSAPMKSRAIWTKIDRESGRDLNPRSFRTWRVINSKSKNAQGRPRSYQFKPSSGSWRDGDRFESLRYDIMFTKYRKTEFPYSRVDARQSLVALKNYLNDERIAKEDVVAWLRVSFMHLPRSEDWPAQPIVWYGFDLIPRDFLDASPLKASK